MSAPGSERLRAADRMHERVDYLACYERGRKLGGPLSTLHVLANGLGRPRLGITATRKLGNAVVRNRLRRRCREVYRRWPRRSELPAVDIVVNLRPRAAGAGFDETRRELERQLERLLAKRRNQGVNTSS